MGRIRNCLIHDNVAERGGGIFAYDFSSEDRLIENCVIVGNEATGSATRFGGGLNIRVFPNEDRLSGLIIRDNRPDQIDSEGFDEPITYSAKIVATSPSGTLWLRSACACSSFRRKASSTVT